MDLSPYPELYDNEGKLIDKDKLSLILKSENEDTGIVKFPTLYVNKKNECHIWIIYIENDECGTLSGKYGPDKDYALVPRPLKGGKPKNVDRKNAKTAREDVIRKAFTMWRTKQEKGGYDVDPHLDVYNQYPIIPMTFQTIKYDKIDWNIKWIGQPKLDGRRCIASFKDNKIYLHSRGRQEICFLDHIRKELKSIYDGIEKKDVIFFDGELYADGEMRNNIESIVKRTVNQNPVENEGKAFFYVYDIYIRGSKMPYIDRMILAKKLIGKDKYLSVKTLGCRTLTSRDQLTEYFTYCKERGYEGAMLKSPYNIYKVAGRTNDCVKVKEHFHVDAVILSCTEAEGTRKGCPIFKVSINKEWPDFESVPAMPENTLREIFKNRDYYIGRICVIRYFSMNERNIPEFTNIVEFK